MIVPLYDIARLRPKAMERLRASGQEITDLNIYHMLAVIRTEELKACRDVVKLPEPTRYVETIGGVEVDCVEVPASKV